MHSKHSYYTDFKKERSVSTCLLREFICTRASAAESFELDSGDEWESKSTAKTVAFANAWMKEAKWKTCLTERVWPSFCVTVKYKLHKTLSNRCPCLSGYKQPPHEPLSSDPQTTGLLSFSYWSPPIDPTAIKRPMVVEEWAWSMWVLFPRLPIWRVAAEQSPF